MRLLLSVLLCAATVAVAPSMAASAGGLLPAADVEGPASVDVDARVNASVALRPSPQGAAAVDFASSAGVGVAPVAGSRSMGADLASGGPSPQAPGALVPAVAAVAVLGVWGLLGMSGAAGLGSPLFSRVARGDVLTHEVRQRMFGCISAHPGVSVKEIGQAVGVGWGTTVYHLSRLEREGLVVSERNRQFRRYYVNGGDVPPDARAAHAELQNVITSRLAWEIAARPGRGQTDLCSTVGISAPLAHKHLARLETVRLLTRRREWRAVRYFPTEKLVAMLSTTRPPGPLPAGLVHA